ncbi:unnamed protein product, partial [Allacma fusca]
CASEDERSEDQSGVPYTHALEQAEINTQSALSRKDRRKQKRKEKRHTEK